MLKLRRSLTNRRTSLPGISVLAAGMAVPLAVAIPTTAWADEMLSSAADISGASSSDEPGDIIQPDDIIGGALSATCSWPTQAYIGGCTGTLIHPRVLVYAAHCGGGSKKAQFGEKSPFAFSVTATKCVVGQSGDHNGGDWAYCIMPDDPRLKALPIVPVLHGCEYKKYLKAGVKAWAVGFGETRGTGPGGTGIKSEVEVNVNSANEKSIDVGEVKHGLCHGDSGGGIFLHLQDGSNDLGWRVFGTVTGLGKGSDCAGTTIYTSILSHIKQVEEKEMIDITPCTDAAGNWSPGAECKDFVANAHTAGGSWPACSKGTLIPTIDSCGAGPGDGGTGTGGAGGAGGKGGTGGTGVDGGSNDSGPGTGGQGGNGGSSGGGNGGTAGGGMAGTGGSGTGGSGTGDSGTGDSGTGDSGTGDSGTGGRAGTGGAGTGGRAGTGGSGTGSSGTAGSGTGGRGGTAGSGTAGSATGGSKTDGGAGSRNSGGSGGDSYSPEDPGCGCQIGGGSKGAGAIAALGTLALGLMAVRRRRRSA